MGEERDQQPADPERKSNGSLKQRGRGAGRRGARSPEPRSSINLDELRELIDLIRENGLAEFELEREGFRVRLRRESGAPRTSQEWSPSEQPPQPPVVAPDVSAPVPTEGRTAAAKSLAGTTHHAGAQAEAPASDDEDLKVITSPIVGTFYRAASPNADPFVKIGSQVDTDSVVCIIEAMKLMNEIQAETTGEVVKIYVENGQPVEYGQPLFGVRA
jgi:acetyl-CoA carboxylase biotin carboxyl carrier protein